jgi:Family of unknown function (DUF6988)
MTKELKEHLIRCEKAMQSAKPILGKYEFPVAPRTSTVIGFISMLMEHQESIVILECYGKPGSASALFRSVVESAYRALWINLPATDAEIEIFNKKDKIDLKFGEIAKALDDAYDQEGMDDCSKISRLGHVSISTATPTAGCIKLGGVSSDTRL